MRARDDQAMVRVEQLLSRGQSYGDIRTDLPRDWLGTTFCALLHAAAGEANARRRGGQRPPPRPDAGR